MNERNPEFLPFLLVVHIENFAFRESSSSMKSISLQRSGSEKRLVKIVDEIDVKMRARQHSARDLDVSPSSRQIPVVNTSQSHPIVTQRDGKYSF